MVACIFTSVRKKEIRQFSTITEDILQLVSWLKETDCEMAAMESTSPIQKTEAGVGTCVLLFP